MLLTRQMFACLLVCLLLVRGWMVGGLRPHPPYTIHIVTYPSNTIAQHIASPPISSLAFSFFGTSMLSALQNLLINLLIVFFFFTFVIVCVSLLA